MNSEIKFRIKLILLLSLLIILTIILWYPLKLLAVIGLIIVLQIMIIIGMMESHLRIQHNIDKKHEQMGSLQHKIDVLIGNASENNIKNIPVQQKKLPGTFWGITTFYNPAGYKNKSENYKKFRESSKKQGLKLLCVELAFNGSDFELTKNDADILLQLRCSSVLWQKERLLNIALDSLPKECDKVAWVDAEVIFDNDSWIEETCSLLEKYMIVQPYSSAAFLKKDDQFKEITDYPWGIGCGKRNNGMAYVISNFGKRKLNWFLEHGQPGLAWAGRRKIFDKLNFYDQHILGAGDLLMAHAFYDSDNKMLLKKLSAGLKETYCSWRRKIYKEVKGSVYFTDGQIIHLWHGQRKNRLYGEIDYVLGRYEFDPRHDMKISKNGCFEWNTKKSELHDDIRQYFFKRMEDK